MTTICLIRHGETNWNAARKLQGRTDIPLNANGIAQAKECSEFLSGSSWDAIITSPLTRAKQTAEIINSKLRVPIIEMREFIERCFGDAEGMFFEEKEATFSNGNIPNQEELTSFKTRVMNGIQLVHNKFPNQKILLVAHGAVINLILGTLSNGEIGSGKTRLINACISNIHFFENEWKIKDYNQVTHLSHYNEKDRI